MPHPNAPLLPALLSAPGDAGQLEARSPCVGLFRALVRPGELLQAGAILGEVDVLNSRGAVTLPADAPPLRVAEARTPRGWSPVSWGQALIALQPAEIGAAAAGSAVEAAAEALGLPPGARAFAAPTDGQLYLRPSPADPPYTVEGATLQPGQLVGLIEVMKFFYEVRFELAGFEQGARVLRMVAKDATPVEAGQPLFYVGGL